MHVSKEGSTVSGLVDAVGALTSVALQSGVPIETLVRKFSHSRFEPSGWTRNLELGHASSILDYVFRWMGRRYLPDDERDVTAAQAPLPLQEGEPSPPEASSAGSVAVPDFLSSYPSANGSARERSDLDAPPCSDCGHMMVRNGSCFACLNCGNTSGCS